MPCSGIPWISASTRTALRARWSSCGPAMAWLDSRLAAISRAWIGRRMAGSRNARYARDPNPACRRGTGSATIHPMLDAPDTAVLAVNLGTPETPTAPAVRRYLAEFLSAPRVVSIPALLWQPLLRGLILPLRSSRSAAKYAQVWLPDGSPLMVHTRQLAQAMQALLPTLRVRHAMRYGEPALAGELDRLAAEGARRIVVLPLYPHAATPA
ncbi:hypothetical protein G6F68_011160 [Rhizopus microsporus]|nr:hypothetical protein G6F68_011160 [Rhizopus microsporus]